MKKLFTALFMAVLFFSCTKDEQHHKMDLAKEITLTPPQVIVIANLPDSLQPKVEWLSGKPSPRTVVVPQKSKTPFRFTENGKERTVMLEPPVIQTLPTLKDGNGKVVTDKKNQPFILGDGGISFLENYSTEQGLPSDLIETSFLDNRGLLWFGSQSGIIRYDGVRFTTYDKKHGLVGDFVNCIHEDKHGNLWIGTLNGLSKYDGYVFTSFSEIDGLAGNNVRGMQEDKNGNLWVATNKGLTRFDGKEFRNYRKSDGLLNDYVSTIAEDKKGNLWIGTRGAVSQFNPLMDSIHFTNYSAAQGLLDYPINCIREDSKGILWFGSDGGGLSRFDPSLADTKFTAYTISHGLGSNSIRCITEDSSGRLWFGLGDFGGLSVYDPRIDSTQVTFKTYTTAQGLHSDWIFSITEDRVGNLWLGGSGAGISRFEGSSLSKLTTAQGLQDNLVMNIMEDKDGTLWFGTDAKGVVRFDGKSLTDFSFYQGLGFHGVYKLIQDDQGNIWFANGRVLPGLTRFDGKTFSHFSLAHGIASDVITCIAKDNTGDLWFGTPQGLSRYDGKSFTNYTTKQGLPDNAISAVYNDPEGMLWIGTGQGLSSYDGVKITTYTTAQGLVSNLVNNIAQDSIGNLWIATNEGLSYLSKIKLKTNLTNHVNVPNGSGLFKNFTVADGLSDNDIRKVIKLPNGKLAVGSYKGLTIINAPVEADEDFSITNAEIVNPSTGYPVKAITYMTLDKNNILWISTASENTALVRFDYDAVNRNKEQPTLTIHRLAINENTISWHTLASNSTATNDSTSPSPKHVEEIIVFGKELSDPDREAFLTRYEGVKFDSITPRYHLPVNLVLPYQYNSITIDFAANELAHPQLVEYQYMLEGYDKEWSPVLKKTSATFGNMDEGRYTFKVKARYTGLSEPGANEWTEPVTYSFRVLPPWYRSVLAYFIYGIAFLSMIYPIHIHQKSRVVKAQQEKARKKELAQAKEIEKAYTELKATQSQLIQSEKMASLGELTAGIAHEIQNPLNFVNNFSEVNTELVDELRKELAVGNKQSAEEIANDIKSNSEKINHHGKRADAIVKGMLQHSRSSSGVKEPTDINALADEYLRLAYHGLRAKDKSFNATLNTDYDPAIGAINIVPQDIGRVILNLINNAFYAVNEKLKVESSKLKAEVYEPTVSVSTKKEGNKVLISVKDNGNGIPASIKEKIFQPFFTTKPTGQGTGLGLSLSYDIVKAHGGELRLETHESEGSEFIIQLPYTN